MPVGRRHGNDAHCHDVVQLPRSSIWSELWTLLVKLDLSRTNNFLRVQACQQQRLVIVNAVCSKLCQQQITSLMEWSSDSNVAYYCCKNRPLCLQLGNRDANTFISALWLQSTEPLGLHLVKFWETTACIQSHIQWFSNYYSSIESCDIVRSNIGINIARKTADIPEFRFSIFRYWIPYLRQ